MDQTNSKRRLIPESAASFIKRELPSTRPIVGSGILDEKSIQVLGGVSKVGKSMLAMNQGLCIAAGKPFLLQFEVPRPRHVIYFQAEIAPLPLKKRLDRMIQAGAIPVEAQDRFFHVPNCKGIKLTNKRHLLEIRDAAREVGAEVIIIDPLSRFFGQGDENRASDMQRVVDALDWLVANLGASVILVHHHGKPPADGRQTRHGAQQLRGSSVIFDFGDSYLNLNKIKDKAYSGHARLTFELRNEADPRPMVLEMDTEALWWNVVDEESGKGGGVVDVLKALEALGGAAEREELLQAIQDRTGFARRTATDLILKAASIKKVYVEDLPGRGKPKRYWTPEKWGSREMF